MQVKMPRHRHQVLVVDNCAQAQDLIRRCHQQAEASRAEGQGCMALVLDMCRFVVTKQLEKMRESYWAASSEFGRWSGRLSAESNAERAARQSEKAWVRRNAQEIKRQRRAMGIDPRGLIGRTVMVQCKQFKKGN